MFNMRRRIISIFLLVSLVIPYLFIPLYLKFEIKQVRRDIKHRIMDGVERSELVQLSFTAGEEKQLVWKHAKEFQYKGEWYDIVETEKEEGKTTYWCWWDHEETSLSKKLQALLAGFLQKGDGGPGDDNPFSILNALYDIPAQLCMAETALVAAQHADQFQAPFCDSFIRNTTPPPWPTSIL
jgi:hypothetical protein